MKKDVIPEIPEDARAMFPVDPRILVRRAPSRDFVAILGTRVTLVFTRVGVETRIGSSTTAPRAREETATPRSPHPLTTDAESFSSGSSQAAAVEGARLATLAASRANATSRGATMPPLGASGAPAAANAEYREEAAFASVHDLVHYAIISCPAQRCARRRPTPSPPSPKRAPRHERSRVSETAHDTNSADHRLPPLDAQGHAAPGVPHMRDPGANRTQAYVPAALLAPRTSSLSVHPPHERVRRGRRSGYLLFSFSAEISRTIHRNETRFGRFADAFRPLDVRQTAPGRGT